MSRLPTAYLITTKKVKKCKAEKIKKEKRRKKVNLISEVTKLTEKNLIDLFFLDSTNEKSNNNFNFFRPLK